MNLEVTYDGPETSGKTQEGEGESERAGILSEDQERKKIEGRQALRGYCLPL